MYNPNPFEASERILYIVKANESAPSGSTKISNREAEKRLADYFGINGRIPRGWFNGNFKEFPMSIENFTKFVHRYYKKTGLETEQKVIELAILLYGNEYEHYIQFLEIKTQLQSEIFSAGIAKSENSRNLSDNPVSSSFPFFSRPPLPDPYIQRNEVENLLESKTETSCKSGKPLLIYGDPGSGKSSLMAWLATRSSVIEKFAQRIIWVNGKSDASYLDWLKLLQSHLLPRNEWLPEDNPTLLAEYLRRATANLNALMLLDNCHSVELVQELPVILSSGNMAIFAARSEAGIQTNFPESNKIEISKFSGQEALNLYKKRFNNKPTPEETSFILTLAKELDEHIYAIEIVMDTLADRGWQWEMVLQEISKDKHPSALFKAISIAYKHLDSESKKAFRMISQLPRLKNYELQTFCTLWRTPPEATKEIITTLMKYKFLNADGKDSYTIRDSVIDYAGTYMKEKSKSSDFMNRYSSQIKSMGIYQRFMTDALRNPKRSSSSRPKHPMPLFRRVIRLVRSWGRHVSEWEMIERNSQIFDSQLFGIAYTISTVEQAHSRFLVILTIVILIFMVLSIIRFSSTLITGFVIAILLLLIEFILSMWRDKAWQALWDFSDSSSKKAR
jgi:hypothetical protein